MAGTAIGLMSGTSLDGVDACAVAFDPAPRLIGESSVRLSPDLRQSLLWLATGEGPAPDDPIDTLGRARRDLADAYAEAVNALPADVRAGALCVGAHGQTIRHRPDEGFSLQIIDGARLAQRIGLPVVTDLRSADVALGGQGAPLVPPFHLAAFGGLGGRPAVVNIGGIANVTILEPETRTIVAGFDTGPGNRLLDDWIARSLGRPFDDGGRWAATGQVDEALLEHLLDDPFFALAPPKSTGREQFNLNWLDQRLRAFGGRHAPEDVQATLLALTATTIARAVTPFGADRVVICGGGARNDALLRALSDRLGTIDCGPSDALAAVPPQAVEAMAFAWLAWQRWHALPANSTAATGARGPAVLGALHLPPPPF